MKNISLLITILVGFYNLAEAQTPLEEAQAYSDSIFFHKSFIGYKFYQMDSRINFNQLPEIMKEDQQAYVLVKKAKNKNTISSILGGAGGFLLALQLANVIIGEDPNWPMIAIGGGLVVISIPIFSKSYKQSLNAIDMYNSGLGTSSHQLQWSLGTTRNGIGLTVGF